MDARATVEVTRTPVEHLQRVSRAVGRDVFVKRDDLTHPRYGGNKVRKLARILADARAHDATDLVTVGAAGSHHVLATIVHGRAAGFDVHAVLAPQPSTPHVEEMVLTDLAQRAHLVAAGSYLHVAAAVAAELVRLRASGRRPYFIAVGGSSPLGAAGYVDAVRELSEQRAAHEFASWPDEIVCALGSGGTLAGILAGARAFGVPSDVVGVRVTEPFLVRRASIARLATHALAHALPDRVRLHPPFRKRDVRVVEDQLGRGYGHATDAGREAEELFASDGIHLDPTYTAKAAAGLLARARASVVGRQFLFWHTLSSAPLDALHAGFTEPIPPALRALLRT